MITISINKNDILKSIYFITAIIQKQTNGSMQGELSSKGDLMGGFLTDGLITFLKALFSIKLYFQK